VDPSTFDLNPDYWLDAVVSVVTGPTTISNAKTQLMQAQDGTWVGSVGIGTSGNDEIRIILSPTGDTFTAQRNTNYGGQEDDFKPSQVTERDGFPAGPPQP
jgi:hypothetical protein